MIHSFKCQNVIYVTLELDYVVTQLEMPVVLVAMDIHHTEAEL